VIGEPLSYGACQLKMTVHLSMWAAMGLIWDGAVAWGERVTGWMGEDALVPHWLRALMANL